jgi:hypothetical protein
MKKPKKSNNTDMLEEYNFVGGDRGKYSQKYGQGTNIVVLSPDVAEAFPDSESVNEALRMLIKIAHQQKNVSLRQ